MSRAFLARTRGHPGHSGVRAQAPPLKVHKHVAPLDDDINKTGVFQHHQKHGSSRIPIGATDGSGWGAHHGRPSSRMRMGGRPLDHLDAGCWPPVWRDSGPPASSSCRARRRCLPSPCRRLAHGRCHGLPLCHQ
eukprot:1234269-Pyramimonas_sp.AAC.1